MMCAPLQGAVYEYLDYFVCDFVDCMDWRLHRFSRRRWLDSPVIDFCGDIPGTSFCSRKKNCIGLSLHTADTVVTPPKIWGETSATNSKGVYD
jgi:hypothetical protein